MNKQLLEKLNQIELKLEGISDALTSKRLEEVAYSTPRFCQVLGISKYLLHKWYKEFNLPITYPFAAGNKYPQFTNDDLQYMREFMNEHNLGS